MQNFPAICVGLLAIAILVWLLWPGGETAAPTLPENEPLDHANPKHVAFVLGFFTRLPNAAVAKYALSRFEETHGRRATAREIGLVIGLMESGLGDIDDFSR